MLFSYDVEVTILFYEHSLSSLKVITGKKVIIFACIDPSISDFFFKKYRRNRNTLLYGTGALYLILEKKE